MTRIKVLGLMLMAILYGNIALGQDGIDGNPASVKWMQINTDTVKIIFPKYLIKTAQRVSDYVHHLAANNTSSLGGKVRKINIVLQSNTCEPNGYVGVAPFKSEFYCTNPQDPYMVGGDDFVDVLSVHEYRHALQYANTKRGFANVFYLLQGESGWAMLTNITIPNWFFEGDAVVNETAVTNGGRGRSFAFQQNNNANWYANKRFKYKHMRMGSFKNRMPNHYEYGYLLCSYLRDNYGNDIWAKVLDNTMKLRHIFYPFSNSLRMHTGMSTRQLYEKAYAHYEKEYKELIRGLDIVEGEKLTKVKKDITNYSFPVYVGDDLYVLKSSYSNIPEIVKISANGKEKHICFPSNTANSGFSIANNKIVWTESVPHIRWANYSYSNIVIFDMVSGKKKRLTKNAKFFSPQLSSDGKKIVVVEYTKEQNCQLVIIDAFSGKEISRLNNKDNHYLMYPKWVNDNEIICSGRNKGKFNITCFNIRDNSEKLVWGPINQVVTDIEVANGRYYFSASFSGIDNIFELNPKDNFIKQLSSVPVGAFWPTVSRDGQHLVFSNVKASGSELRKLALAKCLNKNVEVKPLDEIEYFDNTAIKSEGGSIINTAAKRNDMVEKYNRLSNLINIHSWQFVSTDQEIGLSVKSDNILNTLGVNLGYTYNKNEKSSSVNASVTYAGFMVKQVVSFSKIKDREYWIFTKDKYEEEKADFSLVLPLNLSSGIYYRGLTLSSGVSNHKLKFKSQNIGIPDYSFADYHMGVSLYNIRNSAYKNIGCRWGQTISAVYYKSFKNNIAEEFEVNAKLFFPGLMKNHNIEISSAFKKRNTQYAYEDLFEYARGYSSPFYKMILGVKFDYNLPVAYPEFGINGLFYSNRLSAKLFADYNITDFNESSLKKEYTSVGFETFFDVLLGNMINSKIGFRHSFLLNKDYDITITSKNKFEVIFRINM